MRSPFDSVQVSDNQSYHYSKVLTIGRPVSLTFHVIQIPTPLDLALADLSNLTNSVLALVHLVGGQLPSGKTRGPLLRNGVAIHARPSVDRRLCT